MLRYSVASANTSSGVRMRTSRGFTRTRPATVSRMLSRNVAAMVVWMASCRRCMLRAPKLCPIMTEAPMENPAKKNTSRFTMIVVEPIAASACLDTKLPTMMESTVL